MHFWYDSMCFIQAHRVWIHSHSHNSVFQHLNDYFVRSKVFSHQREFLDECGPEEPKAEHGMWVKFSRAASFTHSQELQKKGLWLRYSICLISDGKISNSQSSELKERKHQVFAETNPEISQRLKWHFCGESGASQRTGSNMYSARRKDITGYALVPLCTQMVLKWSDKDIYVCLRLGYNNFADLITFSAIVSSIFWSDSEQSAFRCKARLCF